MLKCRNLYKFIKMASLIVLGGFSLVLVLKIGFTLVREDDNYSTTGELLVGQNYLSYSLMENSEKKEGLNSTNLPIKFVEKDGDSDERSAVEDLEVISVRRIWGINNHDAFTSLVEHNGVLYCA